ncbi:LLM class F420-dependent oxidoreductase [Nocardia sp. NBC_01377]|uniref:LLM class F420-dependent oxidoreductase n=1 Tax=Nocardia sp. NBC_01377 TaxID=2903595 RepID=UPI003247246F
MRFIYHYPETAGYEGDLLDAGPLPEIAAATERNGFDGFSLSEHPAPGARWLAAGGHQTLDPFIGLAFVAAATERLRLITYLTVAPYRNPMLLAKTAASLDILSGGRVTVGLGTGYQKSEFHALGVDFEERNILFDEALDVLPRHWSGEPFSYTGRHFSARDVIARPRPPQQPIPLWIGGNSALSRRRVAERAQGWIPMSGGAELATTARTPSLGSVPELARKITEIRAHAQEAGRTDHIDVVYSYSDESITEPTVDVERHTAALAELGEAGVDWIVISNRTREYRETLDFIEGFGTTYLASVT